MINELLVRYNERERFCSNNSNCVLYILYILFITTILHHNCILIFKMIFEYDDFFKDKSQDILLQCVWYMGRGGGRRSLG